jgi:hypothetical protein
MVGVTDNGLPGPVTSDDLSEAISQLHAAEMAVHYRLLGLIRSYDRSKLYVPDGAPSMAQWLVARLGVSARTAAEWVRVANRLEELPAISGVVEEGGLSWDQLAPLTRLADRETDEALAAQAPGLTAATLRTLAARAKAPRVEDAEEAHRRRHLVWWTDDHQLHLKGQLPIEAGALVAKALDRIASEAPPDPVSNVFDPIEVRRADALVQLASLQVAADADADRATVVVHADVALLAGDDEAMAELEDGPRLAAETARRLACDCRWQLVVEDGSGDIVRLGRTTRQIPAWLVRQLRRRDRGCRFPGCTRTRWLHAHHAHHWSRGGPTDPDNLVMLCGFHHRLVHEGGWAIEMHEAGRATFIRPTGQRVPTGPPPLRADVRHRLFGNGTDPPTTAA